LRATQTAEGTGEIGGRGGWRWLIRRQQRLVAASAKSAEMRR